MALFKVLRGQSSKLSSMPLKDGYCYFTSDDSMFHIDWTDENGVLQRSPLNAQDAKTLQNATLNTTALTSRSDEIPSSSVIFEEIARIDLALTLLGGDGIGTLFTNKMDRVEPTGEGSFSMNRKSATSKGINSTTVGTSNEASGHSSFASGFETTATAPNAHAEGNNTLAEGAGSHAEGKDTVASGPRSHAEGTRTAANGINAHSEGEDSIADGQASHAEGAHTHAQGQFSHAEGNNTIATHKSQHVQGEWNMVDSSLNDSTSRGNYAFIIGNGTDEENRSNAFTVEWNGDIWGARSLTHGDTSDARGDNSYAGGNGAVASGNSSHAEGVATLANAIGAHAEGADSKAQGANSHAEGYKTDARSASSHAEGRNTKVMESQAGHAEGDGAAVIEAPNGHAEGENTRVLGQNAHAEGLNSLAAGLNSHAEGFSATTVVLAGSTNTALKLQDIDNIRDGDTLVLDGNKCIVTDIIVDTNTVLVEGLSSAYYPIQDTIVYITGAIGNYSHSEGYASLAIGKYSHAGGYFSRASQNGSFAHGLNTIAETEFSTVFGKWNAFNQERISAFSIGNGLDAENRSNAFSVTWDGQGYFQESLNIGGIEQGDSDVSKYTLYVNGNGYFAHTAKAAEPIEDNDLTTKKYVDNNLPRMAFAHQFAVANQTEFDFEVDLSEYYLVYFNGLLLIRDYHYEIETNIVRLLDWAAEAGDICHIVGFVPKNPGASVSPDA